MPVDHEVARLRDRERRRPARDPAGRISRLLPRRGHPGVGGAEGGDPGHHGDRAPRRQHVTEAAAIRSRRDLRRNSIGDLPVVSWHQRARAEGADELGLRHGAAALDVCGAACASARPWTGRPGGGRAASTGAFDEADRGRIGRRPTSGLLGRARRRGTSRDAAGGTRTRAPRPRVSRLTAPASSASRSASRPAAFAACIADLAAWSASSRACASSAAALAIASSARSWTSCALRCASSDVDSASAFASAIVPAASSSTLRRSSATSASALRLGRSRAVSCARSNGGARRLLRLGRGLPGLLGQAHGLLLGLGGPAGRLARGVPELVLDAWRRGRRRTGRRRRRCARRSGRLARPYSAASLTASPTLRRRPLALPASHAAFSGSRPARRSCGP